MKATTDNQQQFNKSSGSFLISIAIHTVFVWIVITFGVLQADLLLDRDEVREQSQKAAANQAKREARDRGKRERIKLADEHAKKLREDAERSAAKRLRDHVKSLRNKHEEIKRLKRAKLLEVETRTATEVNKRIRDNLLARAEMLERESGRLSRMYKHPKRSEIAEMSVAATETTRKFLDGKSNKSIANRLHKEAQEVESEAKYAADGREDELGLPEDLQIHQLAYQFNEAVKQAVGALPNMERFNDTSTAAPLDNLEITSPRSPSELYDLARQLEQSISQHYDDFRVGEIAMTQNRSFVDAQSLLAGIGTPNRPDLVTQLAKMQDVLEGQSGIPTISDLNNYRAALGSANDQVGSMNMRAAGLVSQAAGLGGDGPGVNVLRALIAQGALQGRGNSADLSLAMRAMSGYITPGAGNALVTDPRFHLQHEGGKFMAHIDNLPGIRIPSKKIFAEAMAGRRFSRDSARKGWLYLDTWYLIGPWENHGRVDYTNVHPPEKSIDFDATYVGKRGQELRWKYIHSNNIRVIPENAPGDATWYAYTELFFDQPMDMLLAVASDDATKVWINDQVVWQENGLSQWSIGEGVRKVFFKQGTNKILLRAENGPGETMFSVVICPPEAVNRKR